MFCHHCGAQLDSAAQYCNVCGTALASAPGLIPAPNWTAPAGVRSQTGRWIGAGWNMVKDDIGTYLLMAVVFMVLNGVVPWILQGPLMVGFHIVCVKKLLNRPTEFADLFKGFNFFIPALVASLLIGMFTFAGFLLCIIPGFVVCAMYMFTYLFILDKRMDFWPAMQASHAIVKQDYFGFTMFVLAMAGVMILGFICCFVGALVAFPVVVAAITAAYRDVVGFDERTAAALDL